MLPLTCNSKIGKANLMWRLSECSCPLGEGDGQEDCIGEDMKEFSGEIKMFYITIGMWVIEEYQVENLGRE